MNVWFPLRSLVRSSRSNTEECKIQGVTLLIISPLICFAARSSPQWWMDSICQDPDGDPRQQGWQRGGRRCWVSCLDVRWACSLCPRHPSMPERRVCSQGLRAVFGVLSVSIPVAFCGPSCVQCYTPYTSHVPTHPKSVFYLGVSCLKNKRGREPFRGLIVAF